MGALLCTQAAAAFCSPGISRAEPPPAPTEAPPSAVRAAQAPASAPQGADRYRDELLVRQTWAMAALGTWGAGSIATGAALWSSGRTPFVRAVGVQQLAWGAVDLTIAALSYRGIRRDGTLQQPRASWERERQKLRTVLAANVALDLVYVGVGAALARYGRREEVRGAGVGILPQGAFLLVFDSAFWLSI